jgi:Cys-tRNA(Pro)/Cys-tRNA(Cys) deacylase
MRCVLRNNPADVKANAARLLDSLPLTGYIRGGVTALAAKRAWPVCADETIELFDVISVSAGVRGAQIVLAPADYLRATSATVAAMTRPKE